MMSDCYFRPRKMTVYRNERHDGKIPKREGGSLTNGVILRPILDCLSHISARRR
ncbi:MAG: hypothetical protein BMS9Abin28_1585 [Anaerolineae bacterium]|nr:MAG: hypothetical protein BMS9Abin28_1585 [Anaerolineae bacterium]